MAALVLSEAEVIEHLPMAECIEAMQEVLIARARGEAQMPLRSVLRGEGSEGLLGMMPAYRGAAPPAYSVKTVCIFPGNPRRGLDAHQGVVVLFDGETGRPTAVLNGSAVTSIRTAAVTALATRLLAREDARTLAILGSGVQARAHLRSLMLVAAFEQVRVFSPNAERARAFADEASEALDGRARVAVAASAQAALDGADVVVTATNSAEPVLERDWLAPGAHVNAIGASIPSSREIDVATVAAAELFVDARESLVNEAGEYRLAIAEGLVDADAASVAELGEVALGARSGRSGPDALTVFRSLGIGVEDLAAAELAAVRARAAGAGVEVEL
jgi:ornithine cyclodeaminase/alanine dehydrogenase-like protein (mu-crystallin family)